MRYFVALLGLCALAVAWRTPSELVPHFTTGFEYVYNVDQQLATTLNGEQQHSLYRTKALLRLVFPSDKKAICKVENWDMARINNVIRLDNAKLASFEQLQRVEIDKDHMKLLELPFELRYDEGRITEIIFSQDDKTFSENIKRAILNSFQLQLDQEITESNYRVNETTIDGQCETLYTIQDEGECVNNKKQMSCVRLYKSINFDQCSTTNELRYNFYRGEMPSENQHQEGIQRTTSTEFELKRDKGDKFIVFSARTRSEYSMKLSFSNEQYLHGVSLSDIRLIDVKRAKVFPEVETKKSAQSLEYSREFDVKRERFFESGQEDYLHEQQYIKKSSIVDVINNLMKSLVQTFVADKNNYWEIDSESAHLFLNIVKTLRHASVSDLERIDKIVFNGKWENIEFVQSILMDAVASVGTQPSVNYLLNTIQNNEFIGKRYEFLLKKLAANAIFVGQETTNSVWKLCQLKEKNKNFYRTCILTWSRLVRTVCNDKKNVGDIWATNNSESKLCGTQYRSMIMKNLKSLLEKSTETNDRILAIKACGNVGIDQMISLIDLIIRDRSLDQIQRQVAIDSLRFMDHRTSRKIARILMPVLTDRREYPEVRMEALRQLLNRRIDFALLDQITFEMIREPNMNVRSFVATYMMNFADTVDKIDSKLATKIIDCVRMIKNGSADQQQRMDRSGSRFNSLNLNENMLTLARMFSNDSRVIKNLDLGVNAMINQHFMPMFMQFNLKQQNVEKVLKTLLKQIDEKSIDQILVRGRRSTIEKLSTPIQTLKAIYEQLKIIGRSNQGMPQLFLNQREQGMDVSYWYFDQQNLPEFLRTSFMDGQLDLSSLENDDGKINFVSGDLSLEQTVKVPTTFGIPLIYTLHASSVSTVYGNYSIGMESDKHLINKANINLKLMPKYSSQLIHKLEAISPLFTVGVKTQHSIAIQVPLKINSLYNDKNGIKLDLELPNDKKHTYKLMEFSSHTSTLVRTWPTESHLYVESDDRTMHMPRYNQLYKQLDEEFKCPLTGLRYELRGHRHQCGNVDCWLVGDNSIQIHLHPTEKSAKKLSATLDVTIEQPDSVSLDRINHLFEKNTQQLFKNVKETEVTVLKEFMRNYVSKRNTKVMTKLYLEAKDGNGNQISGYDKNVEVICDNKFVTCSLEAHSSFSQLKNNLWKAHISGQYVRPQITGVYNGMKSRHVLVNLIARIGGKDKNSISMRLYGRPSEKLVSKWNFNKDNDYYLMEQNDSDYNAMINLPSSLPANLYTVVVENKFSDWTTETIRPLSRAVQLYVNPWSMMVNNKWSAEKILPKQSFISADFVIENGKISLSTDDANVRNPLPNINEYVDRYTSVLGKSDDEFEFDEIDSKPIRAYSQRKNYDWFSRNDMAHCSMNSQYTITSFDGKSFKLPLNNCYTVLSKDCSGRSTYSILAKRMGEEGFKVKLVTPGHEYTMHLENDRVVIKVDGIILMQNEYKKYGITLYKSDKTTLYILHCERTGAELRYDGKNMAIFLSEDYINRQCGVCGHYSNDQNNVFRMANNELAGSMKEFHTSYLYRDNECGAKDIHEFESIKEDEYTLREIKYSKKSKTNADKLEEDFDNANDQPIKPRMSQRIQELKEVVCFSLDKFNVCPQGTVGKSVEDKEVEFACFDRQSFKAHKLRRQLKQMKDLDIDEEESNVKLMNISVPKQCISLESVEDFDF